MSYSVSMAFIPTEIVKFKGTYDGLFKLETRPKKIDDNYTSYLWKLERPWFFKGADQTELFPMAINLYLKECTEEEHSALLDRQHFLKIKMFYGEDGTVSYIAIANFTLAGLDDPRYRALLSSCPSSKIPCELNIGPLWHYLGIDRIMCQHRHIDMGVIGIIPTFPIPQQVYIVGAELFGRDQYPTETTEEKIKAAEEVDRIFIVRS